MSLDRIAVFLLAQNCLLREALVRVLRKKDDIVVAGAVPFSSCAWDEVSAANPDVILFDSASIALTGPRFVSRLRQAARSPKAIMVGMEEEEATFLRAVGEGVVGYVLKATAAAEIGLHNAMPSWAHCGVALYSTSTRHEYQNGGMQPMPPSRGEAWVRY